MMKLRFTKPRFAAFTFTCLLVSLGCESLLRSVVSAEILKIAKHTARGPGENLGDAEHVVLTPQTLTTCPDNAPGGVCLWRFTSTKGGRVRASQNDEAKHVFDLTGLVVFEDAGCKTRARVRHVELTTSSGEHWRRAGDGDHSHRGKVIVDGEKMAEAEKAYHPHVGGILPGGFKHFTLEASWGGSKVVVGVEPGSRISCWAFQTCAGCTTHIGERFPLTAKVDFKVGAGALGGEWQPVGKWGENFLEHDKPLPYVQDEGRVKVNKRDKHMQNRLKETRHAFKKEWGGWSALPGPRCAVPAQDRGLWGGCWRRIVVEPGATGPNHWDAATNTTTQRPFPT
ncbi:hypothetical protein NFJ02_19g34940 [Pycnococcus provasolii]